MIRRLLLLIGGAAVFWLLVGLPARLLTGSDAPLVFSGTAVLLCLLPMAATLAWVDWAMRQTAQELMICVLGGTGVRMAFVLAGGLVLFLWVPYFQGQVAFWVWLLVVYMAALALDVTLMLAGRPAPKA